MDLRIFHLLFAALCVVGFSACEGSEEHIGQQMDVLSKKLDEYASKTAEYTTETAKKVPEVAEEEYEKLFRFDYQVVEFPRHKENAKVQATLNELGKERWECFHLEPRGDKWIAYCRRRPTSYIRYIKSIIGFF